MVTVPPINEYYLFLITRSIFNYVQGHKIKLSCILLRSTDFVSLMTSQPVYRSVYGCSRA